MRRQFQGLIMQRKAAKSSFMPEETKLKQRRKMAFAPPPPSREAVAPLPNPAPPQPTITTPGARLWDHAASRNSVGLCYGPQAHFSYPDSQRVGFLPSPPPRPDGSPPPHESLPSRDHIPPQELPNRNLPLPYTQPQQQIPTASVACWTTPRLLNGLAFASTFEKIPAFNDLDDDINYGPHLSSHQKRGTFREWITNTLTQLLSWSVDLFRRTTMVVLWLVQKLLASKKETSDYGPSPVTLPLFSAGKKRTRGKPTGGVSPAKGDFTVSKHPKASAVPFVSPIIGRVDRFLHMLQTTKASVLVSILPNGKSQPPVPNNKVQRQQYNARISGFLDGIPADHYIQQQPLLHLGFSKLEKRTVENLQEQLFQKEHLHPVFRNTRITDLHGPHLFAGPKEIHVSLHFDRYDTSSTKAVVNSTAEDPGRHNLYVQLTGKKKWILFPPSPHNEDIYYPMSSSKEHYHVSRVRNLITEGRLDELQNRFPKFWKWAWPKRYEVVLCAGESLHLPARWWHTTCSSEPGIAVNWWFTMQE